VPEHPYARGRWLHARQFLCDWRDFAATSADIQRRIAAGEPAEIPFMALAHVADAGLQRRCAELYVRDKHPAVPVAIAPRPQRERIRLAYLSGDFRNHPIAFLLAGVFEAHDRARFETIGVAFRPPDGSATGARVHAAFERVIEVATLTDAEAIARLRAESLDIAVDLMGHTGESRSGIFAARVAPVQVAYLGYPGTTGLPAMDAILADAVVAPPGCERFYSERILRLPGCFQGNDDRRRADAVPARAECGLPDGAFVFGAFCNSYKITPPVFATWMRLLSAVPDSVLWLLAGDSACRANLRATAATAGVDPARLVFAGRVAYEAHLARLALVDVALDTFPFNGGTTTSDLLWAGVPVVTCAGDAFASRMGASLLAAVGCADLVAGDLAEYEAIARRVANDDEWRASLRHCLGEARDGKGLFDTRTFCRTLERAFETML
jgi:predicted O-linked N-acetylglucosamine transferase (SPINDLY family)